MPQAKPSITKIKEPAAHVVAQSRKRPTVSYGTLSKALERLGYVRHPAQGSHVVFSHPKTKARLFLPWRRDTTNVDAARLSGVYQLVESAGIASRQAMQDTLSVVRGASRPVSKHTVAGARPAAAHTKRHSLASRRSAQKKAG